MQISKTEFIVLMAALTAMVALTIDAILPALGLIADELQIQNANDRQQIISIILFSLAFGQYIYGPISDSVGRKPIVIFGLCLFLIGTSICYLANSFENLLIGRFIQGFGAAAANNVATAIVRDKFAGDDMAQIMSIVMAVFMTVPILAPTLGQLILLIATWREIFLLLFVLAIAVFIWFMLRQPETLPKAKRRPFSFAKIVSAIKEILQSKVSLVFMFISSMVFGAFLTFLNSSQQLIQEDYQAGNFYVLYFAVLAFAFVIASLLNSRLVMRIGAKQMSRNALMAMLFVAIIFALPFYFYKGFPPLAIFLLFMFCQCFTIGLLMGNLNALALEPLGHIAGTGAAMVGGTSTLVASGLGAIFGQQYAGDVYLYLFAFIAASGVSLGLIQLLRK